MQGRQNGKIESVRFVHSPGENLTGTAGKPPQKPVYQERRLLNMAVVEGILQKAEAKQSLMDKFSKVGVATAFVTLAAFVGYVWPAASLQKAKVTMHGGKEFKGDVLVGADHVRVSGDHGNFIFHPEEVASIK